MSRQIYRSEKLKFPPLYTRIWEKLKGFPRILAAGSNNPPTVSGPAAAALLSVGIGCFAMMVTHHLSDTSKDIENIVWGLGSWIPGSHNPSKLWGNIGSYTGKETMLLLGWLVSWSILSVLWNSKKITSRTIFFWMSTLIIAATAMSWHPLFPYLPLS
ncbi:hypothetical protein [Nostoc sp. 106C]|uniref:hypothetical protein n=1 Tax=Nostoc sp. 106C TaxID=1932667 RepID=UPI000A3AE152|nr:hypothetical protein [Nostoc sp. 106C]OUL27540.1 hypothetical protein BV375_19240 [Nostoc sp. 106C]